MVVSNVWWVCQDDIVGGVGLLFGEVALNDLQALLLPDRFRGFGKRLIQLDPDCGFDSVVRERLAERPKE